MDVLECFAKRDRPIVVNEGEIVQVAIPMHSVNSGIEDPATPSVLITSLGNYPNPYNPETTIGFITAAPGNVKLSVHIIKGQKVITLHDGIMTKGCHSIHWNGLDEKGGAVSSGVYFVRAEMNGRSQTHRMVLIK